MLPKFQAVQAAHEILTDPQQKAKYDAERAKLNRANKLNNETDDPYGFRTSAPRPAPTATKTAYPAPSQRPRQQRPGFDTAGPRPNPASASVGAEKLGAFGRPAASWNWATFEQAARADAAKGFAFMRSNQPTPQPPPRPPRPHAGPTQTQEAPEGPASQSGPGLGFPGLSRTAPPRRSGFQHVTPNRDEPTGSRGSAYANYSHGERPQVSQPQPYTSAGPTPVSPTVPRSKPTSPLRHVRSSGQFEDTRPQRPEFQRAASRPYAAAGVGEKTDITGGRTARMPSDRHSPIERNWETSGPHNIRPRSHYGPPPARHHSSSPQLRDGTYKHEPLSSSSDEENFPTMRTDRPKAVPRQSRQRNQTMGPHSGHRPLSADDPALTGYFPRTNYTRLVDEDSPYTYHYPPPDHPDGPTRAPFPSFPVDAELPRPNGDGGAGPQWTGQQVPKYVFPSLSRWRWSKDWYFPGRRCVPRSLPSRLPCWAIPSSIAPMASGPPPKVERTLERGRGMNCRPCFNPKPLIPLSPEFKRLNADYNLVSSPDHGETQPYQPSGQQEQQNVSHEDVLKTFSAADWDGKFSGDEHFRPTESLNRDRKSPSKTSRPRARSLGSGTGKSRGQDQRSEPEALGVDGGPPEQRANIDGISPDPGRPQSFQPGSFSAEEWAEKLRSQKWDIPNTELNVNRDRAKTPKRGSRSTGTKRPAPPLQTSDSDGEKGVPLHRMTVDDIPPHLEDPDAMDIDQKPPGTSSAANQAAGGAQNVAPASTEPVKPIPNGVDMSELGKTAPFAPSETGLKDLDDLKDSLPFQSRPADTVDLDSDDAYDSRSKIRHLNLPHPPRTIIAPRDDELTQERWETYVHDMYAYMHDWNVFNMKMIDHFRARQDQINVGMGKHWISSVSEGPPADLLDIRQLDGPRAGYAAYMQWLEDDMVCRSWWEEACERHLRCFEDLGRVREKVKKLSG